MNQVWQPDINEKVPVAVWMDSTDHKHRIKLIRFIWRGKAYQLNHKRITYHHQSVQGDTLIHYFSFFNGTHYFRMNFNTKKLSWTLEGVYES